MFGSPIRWVIFFFVCLPVMTTWRPSSICVQMALVEFLTTVVLPLPAGIIYIDWHSYPFKYYTDNVFWPGSICLSKTGISVGISSDCITQPWKRRYNPSTSTTIQHINSITSSIHPYISCSCLIHFEHDLELRILRLRCIPMLCYVINSIIVNKDT